MAKESIEQATQRLMPEVARAKRGKAAIADAKMRKNIYGRIESGEIPLPDAWIKAGVDPKKMRRMQKGIDAKMKQGY